MSIKIRCPACNAVHSVHQRMLGKLIRCPECSGEIQVPSAEQVAAAQRQKEEKLALQSTFQANPLFAQPAIPTPTPLLRSSQAVATTAEKQQEVADEKSLSESLTSFRRPKQPQSDDMDMTPMVDVTFLLLIFFMITASFAVQKSIQRPTQKSDQASLNVQQNEEDKDSVTVQVDEFNAYNVLIAGVDMPAGSKQDLIVKLTDFMASTNPGERATKLIVDAHENCMHASVVDALDAGREAGFENFEVRTVEQFD